MRAITSGIEVNLYVEVRKARGDGKNKLGAVDVSVGTTMRCNIPESGDHFAITRVQLHERKTLRSVDSSGKLSQIPIEY